ncbi:MAG TPA: hypothetical protein EYN69_14020 [Flavobacteriales bacterium]|nr:hypothetical protein [Flavobacteriales bacterium]
MKRILKKGVDYALRVNNYITKQRHNSDTLFCRNYIDSDSLEKKSFTTEELHVSLQKGVEVLEELGVTYWVARGTLLGMHRDNDFLKGDKDLDIGVYTDMDIYKLLKALPFEEVLFTTIHKGRYMQVPLLDEETGVIFDIWIYHDENGRLYNRNFHGHFELPVEILSKMTTIDFRGVTYAAPDPDWYLSYWYGDDWREPKSYNGHWSLDYQRDCKGFELTDTSHLVNLQFRK